MSIYLIVETAISPNPQWQSLGLLIAILVLPAVLIAITTLKFVYVMWMISKYYSSIGLSQAINYLI